VNEYQCVKNSIDRLQERVVNKEISEESAAIAAGVMINLFKRDNAGLAEVMGGDLLSYAGQKFMHNTINHHGVHISADIPSPGVIANNKIEFLGDELIDAVDLDFEAHLKECKEEFHEVEGTAYLIGHKKNSDGLWESDLDAEWSAQVECDQYYDTTVFHSHWVYYGMPCSPCAPGQVSIGEPGRFLCYAPPPDLFSEDSEIRKGIFKLEAKKDVEV